MDLFEDKVLHYSTIKSEIRRRYGDFFQDRDFYRALISLCINGSINSTHPGYLVEGSFVKRK